MGVGPSRLYNDPTAPRVRVTELLYYAYHKGFWSFSRGLAFRWRLRACGGRFFVGRNTQVLFPGHLTVGHNVAIGDYVYMNCIGTRGVELGNNVRIREFAAVHVTSQLTNRGVGISIGDGSYVGPHCILGGGGGITIGRNVTCGAFVQVLAENHGFAEATLPMNEQGVTRTGICIDDDCWLGNNVIVLDGVTIGRGCVVGAGAVVTRDIPPMSIAVGNPARVQRARS